MQRVEEAAWGIIELLAEKGGWDDGAEKKPKQRKPKTQPKSKSDTPKDEGVDDVTAEAPIEADKAPPRRSSRTRTTRA